MSVKFKKLALAAAVGTLGFAGMAQASSSLLFPYVTTAPTAYTFVSLFHDPDATSVGFVQDHNDVDMHMYYGYKPVGASATTGCTHLDFDVTISEGALLQFEVGNKVNLPKEFGDLAAGYGEELTYSNNIVPSNVEGFLIVEYSNTGSDIINGEAAVVDTATGLATSYTAEWTDTAGGTAGADFTTTGASEHVTSWYPRAFVSTAWYALPVDDRVTMTPNAGGGIAASIRPVTNDLNIGAYGRQEVYTSGSKVNKLVCFGTFNIDNLLNAQFKEGGWMSIESLTTADLKITQPILLYKTQTTSALGKTVSFIQREQVRTPSVFLP